MNLPIVHLKNGIIFRKFVNLRKGALKFFIILNSAVDREVWMKTHVLMPIIKALVPKALVKIFIMFLFHQKWDNIFDANQPYKKGFYVLSEWSLQNQIRKGMTGFFGQFTLLPKKATTFESDRRHFYSSMMRSFFGHHKFPGFRRINFNLKTE